MQKNTRILLFANTYLSKRKKGNDIEELTRNILILLSNIRKFIANVTGIKVRENIFFFMWKFHSFVTMKNELVRRHYGH